MNELNQKPQLRYLEIFEKTVAKIKLQKSALTFGFIISTVLILLSGCFGWNLNHMTGTEIILTVMPVSSIFITWVISNRVIESQISSRNFAQEELIKNQLFIESIIKSSSDIIQIYSIEDQKNVFINEELQENYDNSEEYVKQICDHFIPILLHSGNLSSYFNSNCPSFFSTQGDDMIIHEYWMRDKTGEWHWLCCKETTFLLSGSRDPNESLRKTINKSDNTETKGKISAITDHTEKHISREVRDNTPMDNNENKSNNLVVRRVLNIAEMREKIETMKLQL